ncbi:MAG: hypothetical protein CXR30_04365 [Geobacter sp.]|nr:MAG: hypothetical protein CXR30_04365 [Geobacter sp.]
MTKSKKLEKLYLDLGDWLDSSLVFFMDLIDEHGKPLALIQRSGDVELLVNDFVYFCVTKSCRSLYAIKFLIEKKFAEDALIILRSIYENYLSSTYVIHNPTALEYFIYNRIGLGVGILEHPITPKGKRDTRKVRNKNTEETSSLFLSISDLARGTGIAEDEELFSGLYNYLCQHTHSNMISSGSYRNDNNTCYTYSPHDNTLQARYYTTLVMALWAQSLLAFPMLPKELKPHIILMTQKAKKLLIRDINILSFSTVEELQTVIPARLSRFIT